MNKNTIAIAIAALLVGGVSVAAFQQARGPDTADAVAAPGALADPRAGAGHGHEGGRARLGALGDAGEEAVDALGGAHDAGPPIGHPRPGAEAIDPGLSLMIARSSEL